MMKPFISSLRRNGIRLVIYLDDLLILGDSPESVLKDLKVTINLLSSLGFLVNVNWKN